jgi:hypothetical protein
MNIEPTIGRILECLARKKIAPRQAVEKLVSAGLGSADAGEAVFAALGGSDLVEIGEDGLKRFRPSGRFVNEVEAEMRDVKGASPPDKPVVIPMTPEQKRKVDELIAQGWNRRAAELMVVESEEDVDLDTPGGPSAALCSE